MDQSSNTLSLFDVMLECFREIDMKVQARPDDSSIFANVGGENATWALIARVDEKDQFANVTSLCPIKPPESRRRDVAEYLTRANYHLKQGNFEMDFEDGVTSFRIGIDVEGGQLTTPMAVRLVITSLVAVDRYLPGLMAVVYAGMPPAQAIEMVNR